MSIKYASYETVIENGREIYIINGRRYVARKSKFCVNYSPLIVSDYMSGKMSGIPSVSTSVLLNKICQARQKVPGSICEKCFAENVLARYSDAAKNAESNYYLLTEAVLPAELFPVYGNTRIARIESFGDVSTVEQAINYCTLCRVNPDVVFGWWTKNVEIVAAAFDIVGKPENVVFIQSSVFVNQREEKRSPYVDKVFTVYDDEFLTAIPEINACLDKLAGLDKKAAKAEKQRIFEALFVNCGGRNCLACGQCYSKKSTVEHVNERLK